MRYSENWITWRTNIGRNTCADCLSRNKKIFSLVELIQKNEPPLHPNCRCRIELMQVAKAGTLTPYGTAGADWFVKYLEQLPDNYLTVYDAKQIGWEPKRGNLAEAAPGYQIFGGIYENRNKHLPQKEGRIWYEADINYIGGYRNNERLVFSNDGLVFVTYDHYKTFIEVD